MPMAIEKVVRLTRQGCVILGLVAACYNPLFAADDVAHDSLQTSAFDLILNKQPAAAPSPILRVNQPAIFTLSNDSLQRLKLQIREPLFFEIISQQLQSSPLDNSLGVSGSFGLQASDELSIELALNRSVFERRPDFQPLGNIHCESSIIEPGAYRATNCLLVSDNQNVHRINDHLLSFGSNWMPADNIALKLNYFQQQSRIAAGQPLALSNESLPQPWDAQLLGPVVTSPFTPGSLVAGEFESRTEGVNLDLQLGFTTGRTGELELGLQLARITDAELDLFSLDSGLPMQWTPTAPFNTAKLDLGWTRGPFSAGIQSFYREPVDFVNHQSLDGMTTFDIHFTWRTPWNANLSIGASNALDAGSEDENDELTEPFDDPFEMIYGRVPYVRYQQDL